MSPDDIDTDEAPTRPRRARTDARWVVPPLILGRRASAAMAAPNLPVGTRLGDHIIAEPRGRDGCCSTYVVTHCERGSLHLARVVRDEHAAIAPAMLAAARRIQQHPHRNLLTILETGTTPGPHPHAFVVHERLVGRSLTSLLGGRGVLEWPLVLAIGLQCAEALAALHRMGLAHTAVRPESAALVHIAGDQFRVVLGGLDRAEAITPGASAIQDPRVRDDLDCLARMLVALTATAEATGSRAPELLTNLLIRTIDPRPAIRPATADELHDLLCVVREHIDPDLSGAHMLGEVFTRIVGDDFEVSIEPEPPARVGRDSPAARTPAALHQAALAASAEFAVRSTRPAPPAKPAARWPMLLAVAVVSLLTGAALRDALGPPAASPTPSHACDSPTPNQGFLRQIPDHRPATVTVLPRCEDAPATRTRTRSWSRTPLLTPDVTEATPTPPTLPAATPEVDDLPPQELLPIPRRAAPPPDPPASL